jgi:hypothetical protein
MFCVLKNVTLHGLMLLVMTMESYGPKVENINIQQDTNTLTVILVSAVIFLNILDVPVFTVVSWVSAHAWITHDFGPHRRLPRI